MRALRASAHTATWIVVFTGALVAGVAVHMGHPVARRLVAAGVNSTLEPILLGRVVVDRVGALGLTSLDDVDAHVDGPDGKPVLRVEGVRVRISTWGLIRRLLGGRRQIAINVLEASVSKVEVALDSDETGSPRIARAFASRTPSKPGEPPGPELHLHLRHVRIAHALVRFEPSQPIDGDVDDLEGSLAIEGGIVTVEVPRAKVVVRGLPGALEARGAVDVHLTTPALRTRVHWDGAVATVRETADVTYDDGHVDGAADFERTAPADIKGVWPGCPFADAATLHAEAHGTLPHLDVSARASLGKGRTTIDGAIDVGTVKHAALRVQAEALDLHSLAPTAPSSDLSASGEVTLDADPWWRLDGRVALRGREGTIGPLRVPATTVRGDVRLPPGGLPTANAEVSVDEIGAPTSIALHLAPRRGALVVTFDADATVPRIERVARMPNLASGSAHLTTSGTIDLGAATIAGRVAADVTALRVAGIALDRGHVDARVAGPLKAPSADVDATGDGLVAGPVHAPSVHVAGKVGLEPGTGTSVLAVHGAQVEIGGETPASASASLVRIAPDGVRVEDAVVEGFGAPLNAALQFSPGKVEVHAKSAGVDLARAAGLAGLRNVGGTAAVNVDAVVSSGSAAGQLSLDLTHASAYGVHDATGHVEARLRGRRVWGRASASVGDVGTVDAHANGVQIGPGSLVTAGPWRKTFGALDLKSHVDLAKLAAELPPEARVFDAMGGVLELTARVERDDDADVTPGVELTLHTEGLELVKGQETAGGLRLLGLDPTVHVTVDADSGDTALQAEVRDAHGPLVALHATSSAVPYGALFSDENPVAAFRATTFEADVDVPSRRIDQFPQVMHLSGLGGSLEGTLAWHGSVQKPSFETTLKLNESNGGVMTSPMDLELGARYDGVRLAATVRGTARNARVLDGSATIDLPAAQALAGQVDGWKASGRVKLDKLPLRTLGWLRDRQIRGNASGELVLDGLHDDARLRGDLAFANLHLGDVACKKATAKVSFDGRTLDGQVRVEHDGGFIEARAHSGARWGRELAPSLDADQPAQVSLTAKQFRAAVLLPFLGGAVTELDGQIDADARVDVDVAAKAVRPQGSLAFRNGSFELATFGNEFHDATATIKATPDGVIRLEDASAHGLSGTVQAAATARFEGLAFAGLRASARMPAKDPLPLILDGVQMGTLDGDFGLELMRAGGGWDMTVGIANAHVELPTGTRSLDVQSLGEVEGVRVGIQRRPGEFIPVSLDTTHEEPIDPVAARKAPLKILVKIGKDVHVTRGSGLNVRLEGQPIVTMTDETAVTGQIRIAPGGTIDVQGKGFEIQNGAITFDGNDPSNPQVVLTAGWQASDGVTWIYADFVGPLKSGQVKLRSSPPKSQDEILAILLYGSSDDATNSVNSGTNYDLNASSPFAAVAGGAATQQLNQALGGLNRALDNLGVVQGISTKIDTSQATPRPEVEVQIARDISLQVAWMIGGTTVTNRDTTLLTVDWHFLRKWFLETTVGDQGTSILNVVWQHRY